MSDALTLNSSTLELQTVQRWRKRVLAMLLGFTAVVILFISSVWRASYPLFYFGIESLGMVMIATCIMGRTWCTLYIGGRKKGELVQDGPYSVVRNPLYVFSLIGIAGIGAQVGSLVTMVVLPAIAWVVFRLVVGEEEKFLADAFGDSYREYCARVPRFLPDLSLWHDVGRLIVNPQTVARTFFESSLFLIAIPVGDLADWLQAIHVLPVLFYLP
ncbi:MAG: isoprenylcysteine carboxylmethyltransferase family protein [Hyphomicrobiaceae bacterium]